MNTEFELPPDVLAAIRANRKIEAIKLLREHRGIDLKDAKELVDAYIQANPQRANTGVPRPESGLGRLILIIIAAVVFYAVYRYFS